MLRDEKLKQAENELINEFCERNLESLIGKSPEEIVAAFLDWQYRRYKVMPTDMGYFIVDFMDPGEPIAYISNKDPNAYQDAYNLCDRMNNYDEIDIHDRSDLVNYLFGMMNQEEEE